MQLSANVLEGWKKSPLAVYWFYNVCLLVLRHLAACQIRIAFYPA